MASHALVTGASAGIGREIARSLVRDRGMTVLATARRVERLAELAGEFPAGKIQTLAGDLGDPEFRAELWQTASRFPGGLDVLINNAGIGNYSDFADQDARAIRSMIEVNLMALMDLTQKAIQHMKLRQSGSIVQISSILGFFGVPHSAVYTASKHAVNGLVKGLRYELRGSGVHVWAACPGRTESEFHAVATGAADPEPTKGRGQSTERVARAIVRGLDRQRGPFLYPTVRAWALAQAAIWLPGLFESAVNYYAHRAFAGQINRRTAGGPPSGL